MIVPVYLPHRQGGLYPDPGYRIAVRRIRPSALPMTSCPFGEPKATHDLKRVPVAIDIRAFNTNRCSKSDISGLRDIVHIVGTRWFTDGASHSFSPADAMECRYSPFVMAVASISGASRMPGEAPLSGSRISNSGATDPSIGVADNHLPLRRAEGYPRYEPVSGSHRHPSI